MTNSDQGPRLWQVAVPAPLDTALTYTSELALEPGDSVLVPFGRGNRQLSGLVLGPAEAHQDHGYEVKSVLSLNEERPRIAPPLLKWIQWVANYYLYPIGQVQDLLFPPLKRKSRGARKASPIPDVEPQAPPNLTPEQSHVLESLKPGAFQVSLLHGVTGSGKTEVYIRLIEQVLQRDESCLVLVPEISLTPQLIRRFAERFPGKIAVLHSQLTEREKTEQWWAAFEGQCPILIGARSAIFCPLKNLGLIIVDEEHETSFKQEEKLKYNARDLAVVRGQVQNCPVLLGSATPSLESWLNAKTGKYQLLTMAERVSSRPLPSITLVNPRHDQQHPGERPFWLSDTLWNKLSEHFTRGHQSALFLNRRGVATTVQCFSCGFIYQCPNCDISLTLHGDNHLVCHYCDYHDSLSVNCPDCKEGAPKPMGLGTETIERDLQQLFPEARILRADRDEIQSREAIEDLILKMENHEIDFLVGTQMIAKGLDFKNLSLVGVVHADLAFNIPDFRASERSFQLCTQVSGRAGRHQIPGEVVIQTSRLDHPSLTHAAAGDFVGFADQELEHRQIFHYPPFVRLAAIRLSSLRRTEVETEAKIIRDYLIELRTRFQMLADLQVLGPTPAPLARLKNRYRYHLLLKASDHKILLHALSRTQELRKTQKLKSKVVIDMDPYSLL